MKTDYFLVKKHPEDRIMELVLNRPEKRNAAPFDCEDDLMAIVDDWERDDNVKVVIIKGAGEHFCGGHDLGQYVGAFGGHGRPTNRVRLLRNMYERPKGWGRIMNSLKFTIAAVKGVCMEWGNSFQVCCDMTIAAEDALFGNPGHTMGISGAGGIGRIFASLIGFKRMREMYITRRYLTGKEATEWGLINYAVPKEELDAEVWRVAQRVAQMPVDGLVTAKSYTRMVYDALGFNTSHTEAGYGHTLALNLRFEPDEFWFFREVQRKGLTQAIRERDARYENL